MISIPPIPVVSGKKAWIAVLAVSVLLGAGLRIYRYSDSLVFQSDQSRDAFVIAEAVENGAGMLPLLGPQARGSGLQLGPFFYYEQFLSAELFGLSPESLAYPDLFWGVLALPAIFIFLRRLIALPMAIILTAFASVSPFLVTFSRFAWNPNSLPFFTIIFALALVAALEKGKGPRWGWLALASGSFGMLPHLHFVALLALAAGLILFLALYRPFTWKELAFCAVIVIALQAPIIANELRSGGSASVAFVETVEDKGSQDDRHSIAEKTFRSYQEASRIAWLLATGRQDTDMILTRGWTPKCDKECRAALPQSSAAMLLLAAIAYAFMDRIRNADPRLKPALAFLGLWTAAFFAVTTLVSYQISTRFYLGAVPVLFVGFGFLAELLWSRFKGGPARAALSGLAALLFAMNIAATLGYLRDLSDSSRSAADSGRDLVFATDAKVTLGQLRAMADEIAARFGTGSQVLVSGESRYARSIFWLLADEHGIGGCFIKGSAQGARNIPHARIVKHKPDEDPRSWSDEAYIPFGTLGLAIASPDQSGVQGAWPVECGK